MLRPWWIDLSHGLLAVFSSARINLNRIKRVILASLSGALARRAFDIGYIPATIAVHAWRWFDFKQFIDGLSFSAAIANDHLAVVVGLIILIEGAPIELPKGD